MSTDPVSIAPDIGTFEIPIDAWTRPFWDASAKGELTVPRCGDCGEYRWPPGPFCPRCQSQHVTWAPAGPGWVYTFTIIPERPRAGQESPRVHVPALVEFPDAGGVRIPAAIVDTPLSTIHVGAPLTLHWSAAVNVRVPVFRVADTPARNPA